MKRSGHEDNFIIVHEDNQYQPLASGVSAWSAWSKYCRETNTFADTTKEFIAHAKDRGFMVKRREQTK